uniref:Mind bomb SH3 repeat domain-containing protein n=1 Tax=Ascaris lumbricoides TaxID=6252 RepID=A0A0M3IVR2_ASCLU
MCGKYCSYEFESGKSSLDENKMTTIIGIITDVDNAGKKARFWTKDLAEEVIVVSPQKDISALKVGNWVSVPSEEVQKRRIETFHVIVDPIPTKLRGTSKDPMKQRIYLRVCIAFPPIGWAELNGYRLLAYGENIGTVGNFALKKLTEENGQIERDVCYKGEIVKCVFFCFVLFCIILFNYGNIRI